RAEVAADSVGQTDSRVQDPEEKQAFGQIHRPAPQEIISPHGVSAEPRITQPPFYVALWGARALLKDSGRSLESGAVNALSLTYTLLDPEKNCPKGGRMYGSQPEERPLCR